MAEITRNKPLELVPFSQVKPRTFNTLLCDGVTVHNLLSFTDLLTLHAHLQLEHPKCRVLASLDDLGQAGYTSGHGTDIHMLDSVDGHDLSGIDKEQFEENGTHCGYLSTIAEFPIRLANLRKRAEAVDLGHITGVLDWETPGEPHDLVSINNHPDQVLRIADEKEVIFQFVPVESAADALAAFPNGYFTCDLNPMQNYLLAKYMEAEYGLALFGIGASFLGFRSAQGLEKDRAEKIAAQLAAFYGGATDAAINELASLLTGRDWLLLRYTES